MYLISIYFDETTDKKIKSFIQQIAKNTGNTSMIDEEVPPHITISAFETTDEETAISCLHTCVKNLTQGKITWASVGTFFPYVLYISPVLNEYLSNLSNEIYDNFSACKGIQINKYYKPFSWIPHTTLGHKLSAEEMCIAFETMQKQFGAFSGTVTKIGLAKTNPHRDIVSFRLAP